MATYFSEGFQIHTYQQGGRWYYVLSGRGVGSGGGTRTEAGAHQAALADISWRTSVVGGPASSHPGKFRR